MFKKHFVKDPTECFRFVICCRKPTNDPIVNSTIETFRFKVRSIQSRNKGVNINISMFPANCFPSSRNARIFDECERKYEKRE